MKFWNWVELVGYILSIAGVAILVLEVLDVTNSWTIILGGSIVSVVGWVFGRKDKKYGE